jgi:hypothetical protein
VSGTSAATTRSPARFFLLAFALAVVDRIAARTAAFDGQVLLLQGDSHSYVADNPTGLANLRRVVVHGATLPFEYLRLTVDARDPDLFDWARVPVP